VSHSFEEGGTTIAAHLLESLDWFDHFDIQGYRGGRTNRSSTTVSASLTRIVTPSTLLSGSYGLTIQEGELGNTWNSVPLVTGKRGPELLPSRRLRHALVLRASQFLPWNGALHLYVRRYTDDWGVRATSFEGDLMQRVTRNLYVGAVYRFHTQTSVDFFTTLATPDGTLRTADSDLAMFDATTVGGKVVLDVPTTSEIRALHIDLGYERYVRTNDQRTTIVTWATGYRF
jgi:hypothetical protein